MSTPADLPALTRRLEPALRYLAMNSAAKVKDAAVKFRALYQTTDQTKTALWDWLKACNGGRRDFTASLIDRALAAPASTPKRLTTNTAPAARLARVKAAVRTLVIEPVTAQVIGPRGELGPWIKAQGLAILAEPGSIVVEVSPALATAWLTLNQGNRTPSRAKIRRFAAAMKAGKWSINGETIKFSVTGRLLDGQSRLRAIVEAGIGVPLELRGGLPDLAQQSMDVGETRKGAHTLEMLGEKYPAVLSPALKMLWRHERGSLGWSRFGGNQVLENMVIAPLLARHPEIKASVGWVMTTGLKLERLMASSSAAFFHYVFGLANRTARDAFFAGLSTGLGLKVSSPVYHLRERLLALRAEGSHRTQPIILRGLVIKAWNSFRAGEKVAGVDFVRGEEFPVIAGAKGGS